MGAEVTFPSIEFGNASRETKTQLAMCGPEPLFLCKHPLVRQDTLWIDVHPCTIPHWSASAFQPYAGPQSARCVLILAPPELSKQAHQFVDARLWAEGAEGAIGSPSDPTTSDARPFQLDTSFSPAQDCACWYDLNGLGTLDSAQQLTVVECTSEPEGATQACAALIEAAAEAVAAPRQARLGISLRPCLLAFVVVPARAAPAVDGVAILREAWRRHLAERPPGELHPVLLVQPLAPRHVLDLRGGAAQQAAFALRDALAPVPVGAPGPRASAPPALVGLCRDLGASHIVLRRLGGGRALARARVATGWRSRRAASSTRRPPRRSWPPAGQPPPTRCLSTCAVAAHPATSRPGCPRLRRWAPASSCSPLRRAVKFGEAGPLGASNSHAAVRPASALAGAVIPATMSAICSPHSPPCVGPARSCWLPPAGTCAGCLTAPGSGSNAATAVPDLGPASPSPCVTAHSTWTGPPSKAWRPICRR